MIIAVAFIDKNELFKKPNNIGFNGLKMKALNERLKNMCEIENK